MKNMRKLDNVTIEIDTDNTETIRFNLCTDYELNINIQKGESVIDVILNKDELKQHIEVCKMFLDAIEIEADTE